MEFVRILQYVQGVVSDIEQVCKIIVSLMKVAREIAKIVARQGDKSHQCYIEQYKLIPLKEAKREREREKVRETPHTMSNTFNLILKLHK